MIIYSINPATGKKNRKIKTLNKKLIPLRIERSRKAFLKWRETDFNTRKKLLLNVAKLLKSNKEKYGKVITIEMGKRISESIAEVEKCAWVCEYYAENAERMLKDEQIKTSARNSYIKFQPLGVTFAIMPWNFPFWQVFRQTAPALMSGNTVLLKHASNVPESSLLIEKIFKEAGAPKDIFQSLLITSKDTNIVIENPHVRMISLTGSETAGSIVASLAGKNIKRSVLELGGSDPFIVLDDSDIEKATDSAVLSRMIVSGQSCIAAKRFIVQKTIYKKFIELFKEKLEKKTIGDPLDPKTEVGPLSSLQAIKILDNQVKKTLSEGAKLITGGKRVNRKGYYYQPTIISDVTQNMTIAQEETFGPVTAIIPFSKDEEAIKIANNSRFGLGASIWTKDNKRAKLYIDKIEAGGVYINSIVKSDPRMPFGGIKFSGYGRELSQYGIKEFVNIKTVWIE